MKSNKSIAAAMLLMGAVSIIGAATMKSQSMDASEPLRLRPSFFTAGVDLEDSEKLLIQNSLLTTDTEVEIAEIETLAVQLTMSQLQKAESEEDTDEVVTDLLEETEETVEEVVPETEAPAEPPAPNYVIPVTDDEFWLLCRLIEAEAGDTDVTGRIIVANVIINRVRNWYFPNSVSGVVYSPEQFQPITTGYIWQVNVSNISIEAVQRALMGEDYSQGATYFCSTASAASGNWHSRALHRLFEYGGNVFYTK